MPAGGGNLQRALGHLLSLDVGEVDGITQRRGEDLVDVDGERRDRVAILEELDRLRERLHRVDIQPLRDRRLAGVVNRDDDALFLLVQRPHRDRQDAMDRLELAIQRQLADHDVLGEVLPQDLAGGGENADRHRQIESRTLLLDVRRCEIDRDFLVGIEEIGVADGGGDPLVGLAHRGVGQTNGHELRKRSRDICLNLNKIGIDP